jgi:hypothetical protein
MIRWSTSGRAASCSSTPVLSAGSRAESQESAHRTESGRVAPPSMTAQTPSPASFLASSA